jgi:ZIP family zinc transporter
MVILLSTLVPLAAALLGGIVTAYRPPSEQIRSVIQHFAAGIIFSAAAVELLPNIIHANAILPTMIGFVLGILAMIALQYVEVRIQGQTGLVTTATFDVFIDGFVLGLSFLHGTKQGLLMTIALTVEILFLGLSVASTLQDNSKIRTIMITMGVALALPVGVAVSLLLTGLSQTTLSSFYAFGLIALLYLVTEELLVEAHEVKEQVYMPPAFFVGFVLLILLEELL